MWFASKTPLLYGCIKVQEKSPAFVPVAFHSQARFRLGPSSREPKADSQPTHDVSLPIWGFLAIITIPVSVCVACKDIRWQTHLLRFAWVSPGIFGRQHEI